MRIALLKQEFVRHSITSLLACRNRKLGVGISHLGYRQPYNSAGDIGPIIRAAKPVNAYA